MKGCSMGELIGRDREIDLIKNHIHKMQSFHVYGPEGVGKTAILGHIYDNWNDLHTPLIPIFCRDQQDAERNPSALSQEFCCSVPAPLRI